MWGIVSFGQFPVGLGRVLGNKYTKETRKSEGNALLLLIISIQFYYADM